MCSPAALPVMGALAVGQAYIGYKGAQAQQEADYERSMAYYNQQVANAEIAQQQTAAEATARAQNAALNYSTLTIQQQEANEGAAEQKNQIQLEAMKAKALARVSAAESGVGGISTDRILNDIGMKAQSDIASIEASRESKTTQAQNEKIAQQMQAFTQPSYTYVGSAPSKGRSGLTIAGALINGISGVTGAIGQYGQRGTKTNPSLRDRIYGS